MYRGLVMISVLFRDSVSAEEPRVLVISRPLL